MYVCVAHACSAPRTEKRASHPFGALVTDDCELTRGCWEANSSPLWEHPPTTTYNIVTLGLMLSSDLHGHLYVHVTHVCSWEWIHRGTHRHRHTYICAHTQANIQTHTHTHTQMTQILSCYAWRAIKCNAQQWEHAAPKPGWHRAS